MFQPFPIAAPAAVLHLLIGLAGLLIPARVAAEISLQPLGKLGLSEIRATFGGIFLGLGVAMLLLNTADTYAVVAAGWFGAAIARAISIVVDREPHPKNFGGLIIEAGVGAMLFSAKL